MKMEDHDAERTKREEEKRLAARGMHLLTGGLTTEGDTFLIGAGAVILFACLYPLIGVWALIAFPVVFAVAVILRAARR